MENAEDFDDDAALAFDHALGAFFLFRGVLQIKPHLNSAAAEDDIRTFVRAWQFESELRHGFPLIKFAGCDSLPGIPPAKEAPPAPPHDLKIVWNAYPSPPIITVTDEMTDIWRRFVFARLGIGEPLQVSAYYCLSVVERLAGNRDAAARRFGIDRSVLRKVGELTSSWGSPTPRKAVAPEAPSLTRRHERWLDLAIRSILFQMGAEAAGTALEQVTMADLPPI